MLGRLAGDVHFQQDRHAAATSSAADPRPWRPTSRRLSTEWIIATSGSVRRTLFRCKWPDHVPADRQIGQRGGLLPELLRPALAQLAAAGLDQRPDRGRPKRTWSPPPASPGRPRARLRTAASAIRPRTRARLSANSCGQRSAHMLWIPVDRYAMLPYRTAAARSILGQSDADVGALPSTVQESYRWASRISSGAWRAGQCRAVPPASPRAG